MSHQFLISHKDLDMGNMVEFSRETEMIEYVYMCVDICRYTYKCTHMEMNMER
jgi:hypothetical protein